MRFLHFGQKITNMSILDMIGSDMGNFIFSEPYNPYDRTANLGVKMAPSQRDPPAAYSETKVNRVKVEQPKRKKVSVHLLYSPRPAESFFHGLSSFTGEKPKSWGRTGKFFSRSRMKWT